MKESIPLERATTDAIMRWLKANGYSFVVKIHGAGWQSAGLPDIVTMSRKGRFVGLEVKRPKIGAVTKLQRRMLENINLAGGYGVVVRSVEDAAAAMAAAEAGNVAFHIDPGER